MIRGCTSGAKYLRQFNHQPRHERVWTEYERRLLAIARDWLYEGVPLREVIRRINRLNHVDNSLGKGAV